MVDSNSTNRKNQFVLNVFFCVCVCNCVFVDNIQKIPSHKFVLATGSSVFFAMFFGGLADDTTEIKVPDVEPTAFLTLLR